MNKKTINTILLIALFAISSSFAQEFPKKEIMKEIGAKKIEMDAGNGDGVFKAQSKKTKKWGMYQWMFEGTEVTEMIPMQYDKVDYFPVNGAFTKVYIDGKIGLYLSKWSYYDKAKQTVECKYDELKKYKYKKDQYSSSALYTAMKREGKWGWVNWLTGEEMSEFIYETLDDLPTPDFEQ